MFEFLWNFERLLLLLFSARSERYHHLASDEDEETNDEESSLEIRQFASWSHRFSKVRAKGVRSPLEVQKVVSPWKMLYK